MIKLFVSITILLTILINGSSCMSDNDINHLIPISNSMDDVISKTDYLIAVYSSAPKKPCFYFCKYNSLSLISKLILNNLFVYKLIAVSLNQNRV
jgi:hypothetical protein